MAIPAQGLTFQWRGQTLQEISSLECDLAREAVQSPGRDGENYYIQGGELRLTGFSSSNIPASDIGRWGRLQITAPAAGGQSLTLWNDFAILNGFASRAQPNGVVSFAFVFRLYSTTGGQAGTIQ